MKNLIIILFILFLAGCTYSVSKEEMDIIQTKCNKNDGLKGVQITWVYAEIYCEDGAKFDFYVKDEEIEEIIK